MNNSSFIWSIYIIAISVSVLSFICFFFSIFVWTNLRFNCFPIILDVFGVLDKSFIGFSFALSLQESLSVCNHSVNMGLVLHCNFQCSVPFVQLDVQFNGSVEKTSWQKNALCFRVFLAIKCKSCISAWFRWQFFYVIDVLNLISFINCSQSNFNGIQFSTINTHCC